MYQRVQHKHRPRMLYLESANGAIAIKNYFVIAHTYPASPPVPLQFSTIFPLALACDCFIASAYTFFLSDPAMCVARKWKPKRSIKLCCVMQFPFHPWPVRRRLQAAKVTAGGCENNRNPFGCPTTLDTKNFSSPARLRAIHRTAYMNA